MKHPLLTPDSALLDLLHDAVICTDLTGTVTYCNRAAQQVYGYESSEFVGSNVARLYPDGEIELLRSLIREVLEHGKADRKLLNVAKDGRQLGIHLSVSLLTDSDGTPVGMVGFSIDTTELDRAEQELHRVEEINRAARAATGVGTWQWDLQTGDLWWDATSATLLGVSPDAFQSYEGFLQRVHASDRDRVNSTIERSVAQRTPFFSEYRVLSSDGSVRWLSSRGRIRSDASGKPVRMLGTAVDVSAEKLALEQLREAEAKYRVLYDSPMIGVALGDLDTFTDVNDAFCSIVGYSREELLDGIRWQDMTPTEHLVKDFAALEQMIATGVCAPFEKEYIRKDGQRVNIILGAALVSREPLSWSCFILDVTAQHRAMNALRGSEQMAAAAKMGSMLAHEINNPLAALSNAMYLLRYGPETLNRQELLSAADVSLNRLTRITRQMIGIYSNAEKFSDIKIGEILEDTLAGHAAQITAKQLRVERRNEMGESRFRGIEADVRRLLSVLVTNAVEHAPARGRVKLHVSRGKDWNEPVRDGIRIVVADDGPGIPTANLSRVFDPFFSTHATPAKGLGMWVGMSIVEKSKGRMKVRSTTISPRTGTCISVFLPDQSVLEQISA